MMLPTIRSTATENDEGVCWEKAIEQPGIYRECTNQGYGNGRLVVFDNSHYFWWTTEAIYRPAELKSSRFVRGDERMFLDIR